MRAQRDDRGMGSDEAGIIGGSRGVGVCKDVGGCRIRPISSFSKDSL